MSPRPAPVLDRFLSKFTVAPNGCWEWTGTISSTGYGVLWLSGGSKMAHRIGWELLRGPIPDGLHIDHLCRNTRCVNPDHLEPVTPGENNRRGETFARANLAKTACPAGHPYVGDNLEIGAGGRRICATCRRRRWRAYWHGKRKFNAEAKERHVEHNRNYRKRQSEARQPRDESAA